MFVKNETAQPEQIRIVACPPDPPVPGVSLIQASLSFTLPMIQSPPITFLIGVIKKCLDAGLVMLRRATILGAIAVLDNDI